MSAFFRPFEVTSINQPIDCLCVMQWNIFAQGFVQKNEFAYCPSDLLKVEKRLELFKSEILDYSPDIICLQEADIHSQIVSAISYQKSGSYEHIFAPKPLSPCLAYNSNFGPDGMAVVFRRDKLKLQHQRLIPTVADGSRCALLVELEHIRTGFTIFVVCVHLKANPQFSDFRRNEIAYLLRHLSTLLLARKDYGLFIVGDFNAEPWEPSIQALKSSDFGLASAYASASGGNEAQFTTWKIRKTEAGGFLEVQHTIDYIFYSMAAFELLGIRPIPKPPEIGAGALPSEKFPSDHINLIAHFGLPAVPFVDD
uniref:Nocturnin n=2 Tax=Schistocephalus solidus TaxID=70667 RepID=A0A0V0JBC8_SCHSO